MSGQDFRALVPQLHVRPALRTGIRLSVEPAVAWVLVFGPARGAHREAFHRRPRPIVRQGLDNAETGTTVCAVRERIPVAAVARIEDLLQALRAGAKVRQNQSCPVSVS